MLRKFAIRVYSQIFHMVTLFHLVPYHWDSTKLEMSLPNSRRNNLQKKWLWPFMVVFQTWYFLYLVWKFVKSFLQGESTPFLIFQLVWNITFLIPLLAHYTSYKSGEDISRCISLWMRLESGIDTLPPRALQSFVLLFTPVAYLHWISHVFLFFENPNRPQYLYTLWNNKEDTPNLFIVFLFAAAELCVNFLNWQMVLFGTLVSIGFSNSLASWLHIARHTKDESRAIGLYVMAQRFTLAANEALYYMIPGQKVILMLLLITSVYNTSQMDLPAVPYMLMPLTTVAGTIFFLCCYPPMGAVHDTSLDCLHHWRHKSRRGFKMKVQILMYRRSWVSFRPIGIWVAHFYVIRQKTVLVFFSIVAYYVMTLLCSA